jgi:hypothetical protein
VGDFLANRPSTQLGSVIPSYKPGVTPTDLTTSACPITPSPRCAKRCRSSAARSMASRWTTP